MRCCREGPSGCLGKAIVTSEWKQTHYRAGEVWALLPASCLLCFPAARKLFFQASCVPNLPLQRCVLVHLRATCVTSTAAGNGESSSHSPAFQLDSRRLASPLGLSLSPESDGTARERELPPLAQRGPQLLAGISKRGSRPSPRSRVEERRVGRRLSGWDAGPGRADLSPLASPAPPRGRPAPPRCRRPPPRSSFSPPSALSLRSPHSLPGSAEVRGRRRSSPLWPRWVQLRGAAGRAGRAARDLHVSAFPGAGDEGHGHAPQPAEALGRQHHLHQLHPAAGEGRWRRGAAFPTGGAEPTEPGRAESARCRRLRRGGDGVCEPRCPGGGSRGAEGLGSGSVLRGVGASLACFKSPRGETFLEA